MNFSDAQIQHLIREMERRAAQEEPQDSAHRGQGTSAQHHVSEDGDEGSKSSLCPIDKIRLIDLFDFIRTHSESWTTKFSFNSHVFVNGVYPKPAALHDAPGVKLITYAWDDGLDEAGWIARCVSSSYAVSRMGFSLRYYRAQWWSVTIRGCRVNVGV